MPPTRSPSSARDRSERRVVALLLAGLCGMGLMLAAINVRATMHHGAARERAGSTLARAGLAQSEFYARRGRFAFWEELAAEGMRLPEAMRVDTSNATASHWYLRVFDHKTGLVCDRLGLLTDPPGAALAPNCRAY